MLRHQNRASPGRIKCHLNGDLIHCHAIPQATMSAFPRFDWQSGKVIMRLVNPAADALLPEGDGAGRAAGEASHPDWRPGRENAIRLPDAIKSHGAGRLAWRNHSTTHWRPCPCVHPHQGALKPTLEFLVIQRECRNYDKSDPNLVRPNS